LILGASFISLLKHWKL